MDITVTLPDDAPPETVDQLEQAIEAAGGTWNPAEPGLMKGDIPPDEGEMTPEASIAAGPAAGAESPGAAMQQAGAFALRPRA